MRTMSQQELLVQELTVSQILREYGENFTQIPGRYSNKQNGRCALGVLMSYLGWDGRDDFAAIHKLFAALDLLVRTGINSKSLTDMNDSGYTFDEIADYIDKFGCSKS
jgi:hypothetical protein